MGRRFSFPLLALSAAVLVACAAPPADDEQVGADEAHFDSADGNPTHPTHSILAEFAIKTLKAELPEVATFEKEIVDGANRELHELVSKTHEALRLEIGGNNWSADHPELLWEKAQASYAAGDKSTAFFYVGVLLHYVQDMGVPAHAFHVIHQASPIWEIDNFEMLAFFRFHGDLRAPGPTDPVLASPVDYIEWSAQSARDHFNRSYPGQTYTKKFLPQAYADLSETDWAFLGGREAHCAHATAFALRAAATLLAAGGTSTKP